MFAQVLIGFFCLTYFSELSTADSIKNFIVLDQAGKNTCIGDLHCFFSLHNEKYFTLSFDLTLEKNIEKPIYNVIIEKSEEADIMKKDMFLCYEEKGKNATLADNCSDDTAVVRAGMYHVEATIEIPKFKDIASMYIKGPNGAEGFRGVVSTLSDHPPIQLYNPKNGAC